MCYDGVMEKAVASFALFVAALFAVLRVVVMLSAGGLALYLGWHILRFWFGVFGIFLS